MIRTLPAHAKFVVTKEGDLLLSSQDFWRLEDELQVLRDQLQRARQWMGHPFMTCDANKIIVKDDIIQAERLPCSCGLSAFLAELSEVQP